MTPHFLNNDEKLVYTDIGPMTITATFDDKRKETVSYFCPNEFFADYFRIIKQMMPATEETPAVLLTNEDYNDA